MKNESLPKKRIAFLFRYGVREHKALYPALPHILRGLGERYDVLYIGPDKPDGVQPYAFPGVSFLYVPFKVNLASFRDKLWKLILWYGWLPWLALRCRFWKADLIWIDESVPLVTATVQLWSGRPVAVSVVDFFLEIYTEKRSWMLPLVKLAAAVDRWSWHRARGIITRAEAARQYLMGLGIDGDKIRTVRDACIPDLFVPQRPSPARERYGFGPEDVVLCHHGVLHPNKSIPHILEWMAPLMREDQRYKFLVVGSGPDEPAMRESIKRLGMEKQVVLTGWLPTHRDVNECLNAADIGLVMRIGQFSDHFHCTSALTHCMMCELPVLASRMRGIMEILKEGEQGYAFDPNDGVEFIEQLKKMGADPERRRQMGQKARRTALETFSMDKVAQDSIESLERLL